MPRNYAKKKKSHKAAMVTIFIVVAFFCGTLSISNRNKQKELDKDRKEIERLEAEIAAQEKRTLDLNDEEFIVLVNGKALIGHKDFWIGDFNEGE